MVVHLFIENIFIIKKTVAFSVENRTGQCSKTLLRDVVLAVQSNMLIGIEFCQ